jgi:hypothetical protein
MKLADLMDVLVDTEYLLLDKTGAGVGKGRVTYEGKVEGCANLYPNSKVSKATAAYEGDCLYISIRV